jgi:hypothetical protein
MKIINKKELLKERRGDVLAKIHTYYLLIFVKLGVIHIGLGQFSHGWGVTTSAEVPSSKL